MADNPLYFYGHTKPDGEFSNFWPAPIEIDGKVWPTTEHYFQKEKFPHNPAYQEQIRYARTPAIAKKMGSTRLVKLRDDWEQVKDAVMDKALRAKFTQHPELREKLLATGERPLVEHTVKDSYWADGGDGSGRNQLGKALCNLRDQLRREQKD